MLFTKKRGEEMKKNTIYKCQVCGLVTEVLNGCDCAGSVICCGREMTLLEEQTADVTKEKHVPFPEETAEGILRVSVGRNEAHPMTEAHHIAWIEIRSGETLMRRELKAGDQSCAEFPVKLVKGMRVREYCNIHGLWSYEVK